MSHDSMQICEGVKALVEEAERDKDAEISRLREALEKIANLSDVKMADGDGAREVAREALNRGKDTQ